MVPWASESGRRRVDLTSHRVQQLGRELVLQRANSFGRFAHSDLVSVADGLRAEPPSAVADAAAASARDGAEWVWSPPQVAHQS